MNDKMTQLSIDIIVKGMAAALPTHRKDDEGSDLASSYEVIALLVHSYLVALGFKLDGFNEDKPLAEAQSLAPRLPPQWNNGYGSLSFVYKHNHQSLTTFVIRVDRMGTKVEVKGLAVGHDDICRFERKVSDVVVSSRLPIRISMSSSNEEDRSDLPAKLREVFKSDEAIFDILHDLETLIIQKLISGFQSIHHDENAQAEANARTECRNQELQDPNHPFSTTTPTPSSNPDTILPQPAQPKRPAGPVADFPPPDFEDEHQMNQPHPNLVMPGRPPIFNIGHDDLNPPGLGPHDPLRSSFIGGGLPRPGGGGMHPTFNDPLFTGQGSAGPGGQGGGYDPQVPPGARWDPLGPGGRVPRFPGPGGNSGSGYPFGGPGGGGII